MYYTAWKVGEGEWGEYWLRGYMNMMMINVVGNVNSGGPWDATQTDGYDALSGSHSIDYSSSGGPKITVTQGNQQFSVSTSWVPAASCEPFPYSCGPSTDDTNCMCYGICCENSYRSRKKTIIEQLKDAKRQMQWKVDGEVECPSNRRRLDAPKYARLISYDDYDGIFFTTRNAYQALRPVERMTEERAAELCGRELTLAKIKDDCAYDLYTINLDNQTFIDEWIRNLRSYELEMLGLGVDAAALNTSGKRYFLTSNPALTAATTGNPNWTEAPNPTELDYEAEAKFFSLTKTVARTLIDHVLFKKLIPFDPPSPPPVTQGIRALVRQSASHRILSRALEATELGSALEGGIGPVQFFTLFAPTDAAFEALDQGGARPAPRHMPGLSLPRLSRPG